MSSPPPYPPQPNPLKRPSISSSVSQPLGKKPRMHPLRQTSFPNLEAERSFGAASDAGSVTGSFTGSLGGTSTDGVFARGKKRGRKSKAEKEREREREDALSFRGDGTRFGSADVEGSVRGGMGGGGGADDADEDEDEDEGELFGREEGMTDTETEKKNLAYVVSVATFDERGVDSVANTSLITGSSLTHSIPYNQSDTICTSAQSSARKRSAALLTTPSPSLCRPMWSLVSTVLPKSSLVRWSRKRGQFRRNGPRHTTRLRVPPSRPKKLLQRKQRKPKLKLHSHNPRQQHLHHQGHPPPALAQVNSAMGSRRSRLTTGRPDHLLTHPQPLDIMPPLLRPLNSLARPQLKVLHHVYNGSFDFHRIRTGLSFYLHTCERRCDAQSAMGKVVEPVSPASAWTISA